MLKLLLVLIALCAICHPAAARTTDCSTLRKSSERLACYDRISIVGRKPPVENGSSKNSWQAIDDETARMKRVLKPICRNC